MPLSSQLKKIGLLVFGVFLVQANSFADTTIQKTALVRPYTKDDGSRSTRIEIKTTKTVDGYETLNYRMPTVAELKAMISANPGIKAAVKEAFETDQDPMDVLGTFDDSDELNVNYEIPTLSKIAKAMNDTVFKNYGGTASTKPEPGAPKASGAEAVLQGVKGTEAKHIDMKKLAELLKRKETDLKGKAAESKDASALYDAVAILLSDTRCGFKSVKSKQLYLTKGLSFAEPAPIDLDENTVDIGGGSITFKFTDSSRKAEDLTWDANHFEEMTVAKWLYGSDTGPSNGHVGLYKQIAGRKLCGMGGVDPAEGGSGGGESSDPVHSVGQ